MIEYIVTNDAMPGRIVVHTPGPALAALDAQAIRSIPAGTYLTVQECGPFPESMPPTRWLWDGSNMQYVARIDYLGRLEQENLADHDAYRPFADGQGY